MLGGNFVNRKVTLPLLLICFIFIFSGCMKKPVNVSLKLKKGDAYKLEIDKNEKVTQNIKGQKTDVESKSRISYLCHVANIDDNKNADIKVTFDSINMKNKTDTGQTATSNDEKAMSQGIDKDSKIYTSLIGKSFRVKIGEYGKVKQVIGMDDVVNSIFTELNIKDESEKEGIKKIMKDEFGEEAITKRIERITSVYPNKTVKVGEVWKTKAPVSDKLPVEAENQYSLKESDQGTSEVLVESKIKTKENAEPVVVEKIKVNYEDIAGTQKGTITLNEKTGLIKRSELESDYSGKMRLYSEDPNVGAQIFPISVKEKTVVNVLRQ